MPAFSPPPQTQHIVTSGLVDSLSFVTHRGNPKGGEGIEWWRSAYVYLRNGVGATLNQRPYIIETMHSHTLPM